MPASLAIYCREKATVTKARFFEQSDDSTVNLPIEKRSINWPLESFTVSMLNQLCLYVETSVPKLN